MEPVVGVVYGLALRALSADEPLIEFSSDALYAALETVIAHRAETGRPGVVALNTRRDPWLLLLAAPDREGVDWFWHERGALEHGRVLDAASFDQLEARVVAEEPFPFLVRSLVARGFDHQKILDALPDWWSPDHGDAREPAAAAQGIVHLSRVTGMPLETLRAQLGLAHEAVREGVLAADAEEERRARRSRPAPGPGASA